MAQDSTTRHSHPKRDASLLQNLLVDATAAVTAAASISPIITATDRSVVESVSSGKPLVKTLFRHLVCPLVNPRRFFLTRPVFVVWTLYAATYLTANTSETLIDRYLDTDQTIAGTLISSAVFAVNTPLSVWKDVRFAQFFGSRAELSISNVGSLANVYKPMPRTMPVAVSAAFLTRDIITVFGSFAVAPLVASAVPDSIASTAYAKASTAQLIVPAMTQVFATPAHLLGLDLYNRPKPSGFLDRANKARHKLVSTTIMRAFRLIPAYGFGIILNSNLRSSLRGDR